MKFTAIAMLLSVFGYQAESKYSHAKNDNYGSIDFSIAIKSMLEIINNRPSNPEAAFAILKRAGFIMVPLDGACSKNYCRYVSNNKSNFFVQYGHSSRGSHISLVDNNALNNVEFCNRTALINKYLKYTGWDGPKGPVSGSMYFYDKISYSVRLSVINQSCFYGLSYSY